MSIMLNDYDMPMDKVQKNLDCQSFNTKSTNGSSQGSNYNSDDEDYKSQFGCYEESSNCNPTSNNLENAWKKKVKTELCRFWLLG